MPGVAALEESPLQRSVGRHDLGRVVVDVVALVRAVPSRHVLAQPGPGRSPVVAQCLVLGLVCPGAVVGRHRCGEAVGPADPLSVPVGLAEQHAVHGDAAQEEMKVVFPGEADPGEDLGAALGEVDAGVRHPRLGHADDLTRLLPVLLHRPDGGGGNGLARLEGQAQVGQLVLHRLKGADGPAERRAVDGVPARELEEGVHGAHGLRGGQHAGQLQLDFDVPVGATGVSDRRRGPARPLRRRTPSRSVASRRAPRAVSP